MSTKAWRYASVAIGALMLTLASEAQLKIQFDFTDGVAYSGTESPGHAAGAFTASDTVWNPIKYASGDITGLSFSNGTAATGLVARLGQPFVAPYIGTSWNYGGYVTPYTALTPGTGIYNTSMVRKMMYRMDNLGFSLAGLAAGRYKVYVTSVHPDGLNRTYNVSVGLNLQEHTNPVAITAGDATAWENGKNYLLGTVTVGSTSDFIAVIVGGTLPILNGIQIVQANLPGDANGDAKVDFADYLILEATFGNAPSVSPNYPTENADFDNSGTVDFADYLTLESAFGTGTTVPEPMTLSLLGISGLALLRRRA